MTEFDIPSTLPLYNMLKMQFANLSEDSISSGVVPEDMTYVKGNKFAKALKDGLSGQLADPKAFNEFYTALKPNERRAFLEAAKAALPQDTFSYGLAYRNANRQAALEEAARGVGDIAEVGAIGTKISLSDLRVIAEDNLEKESNASSKTTEPLEYDFDDAESVYGEIDDTERFDPPGEGPKAVKGSRFKIPEIKIPKIELPKVPNLGIMDRVRGKKPEVVQKPNKILDAPEGAARELAAAKMLQRNFRGKLGRDRANVALKEAHPMRLADVAKAAGKDNAKQLKDALYDVEFGEGDVVARVNNFATKLLGLRVTDEFVAVAETRFVFNKNAGLRDLNEEAQASKAALAVVYSEALRQDIVHGTVSQARLKKYQEVLGDLNNVQIKGQPIMHYATAQAMESGNNLVIGQLAKAGLRVDEPDTQGRTALQAMIADKGDRPLKAPKDRYFDRAARALLYSGASAVGVVAGEAEKDKPNAGIKQYIFELSRPMIDSKASSLGFAKDQAVYKASVSALETGKTTKKGLGVAAKTTGKVALAGTKLVGKGLVALGAGAGALAVGATVGTANLTVGAVKTATGLAVVGTGTGAAIAGAGVAFGGGIVYAIGRIAVSSIRLIEDVAGGAVRGARLAGSHMFDSLGSFKNQRIKMERQLKKLESVMSEGDKEKVTIFSSNMSKYVEAIKAGKSAEELKPIKKDLDISFSQMKKIQTIGGKDALTSAYSEFTTAAKDADRALKKIYSRENLRHDDRLKHNAAAYKVLVGYASEFASASAGVAFTGIKIATHQKGGEVLPKLQAGFDYAKSSVASALSSVTTGKAASKKQTADRAL